MVVILAARASVTRLPFVNRRRMVKEYLYFIKPFFLPGKIFALPFIIFFDSPQFPFEA